MELGSRFDDAVVWAKELHAGQTRKLTGGPYFAHLLATCATVVAAGGDEDEAIAALLHDAVEDQGGRPILAQIVRRFGDRVGDLVEGCTDADETPKPPWRPRKEAHLARLAAADAAVRRIKAADALDNVRSLIAGLRRDGETIWSRFRGGRDGTLWYYRRVAELTSQPPTSDVATELAAATAELSRLAGDHC